MMTARIDSLRSINAIESVPASFQALGPRFPVGAGEPDTVAGCDNLRERKFPPARPGSLEGTAETSKS